MVYGLIKLIIDIRLKDEKILVRQMYYTFDILKKK